MSDVQACADGFAAPCRRLPMTTWSLRKQPSSPNAPSPMSIIVQLAGKGVALTLAEFPRPLPSPSKPKEPPVFSNMPDKLSRPLLPAAEPSPSSRSFMLKNPPPPVRLAPAPLLAPPENPSAPEKPAPTPLEPFELDSLNNRLAGSPLFSSSLKAPIQLLSDLDQPSRS